MAALALSELPAGSDVFIDANIFIYGLTPQSSEATDFLRRCSREEVYGVTLFEIVNEATHRFMLAEAVSKGDVERANAKTLGRRPEVVRNLTEYWVTTRRILGLNLLFLATEREVLIQAHQERQTAGLLTNDSMIVACMRNLGLERLASNDGSFDRVPGIQLYSPTDVS
ncbi:MAG: type II toxin-antitoxin system VapC family toxin [Rhodothermia bacterium]